MEQNTGIVFPCDWQGQIASFETERKLTIAEFLREVNLSYCSLRKRPPALALFGDTKSLLVAAALKRLDLPFQGIFHTFYVDTQRAKKVETAAKLLGLENCTRFRDIPTTCRTRAEKVFGTARNHYQLDGIIVTSPDAYVFEETYAQNHYELTCPAREMTEEQRLLHLDRLAIQFALAMVYINLNISDENVNMLAVKLGLPPEIPDDKFI